MAKYFEDQFTHWVSWTVSAMRSFNTPLKSLASDPSSTSEYARSLNTREKFNSPGTSPGEADRKERE